MQFRIGDFVRTDEQSWVNIRHIMEVRVEPRGDTNHPNTWKEDDYEVQIVIAMNDMWFPDKDAWEEGAKHASFLQMTELQHRDVMHGTKEECESVVKEIIGVPTLGRGTA